MTRIHPGGQAINKQSIAAVEEANSIRNDLVGRELSTHVNVSIIQ